MNTENPAPVVESKNKEVTSETVPEPKVEEPKTTETEDQKTETVVEESNPLNIINEFLLFPTFLL